VKEDTEKTSRRGRKNTSRKKKASEERAATKLVEGHHAADSQLHQSLEQKERGPAKYKTKENCEEQCKACRR